jgi:glycosyltransferase involved in cell wall biosynthesis
MRESIYDKSFFLYKAVQEVQPDFVHAHYTHSDIADHYRELGLKIPFILTHHSRGVSESIPLYDYVVFLSHFQRRNALKKYPDINDKSRVIHNCVSDDYLRPVTPQKSKQVLFLSNLKKGKGFDILLDAFCSDAKLDKYQLSVIGDGQLLPEFKATASRNRADNIRFLGRVSIDENIEEMQKSNLFVVPSRGEGFGTVYIEALCCGLPIIGFPPIVEELNETLGIKVGYGFDAHYESSGQLAQRIDEAMNSDLTELSYRNELKERTREHFSFDTFKKNYLKMYRDLSAKFS